MLLDACGRTRALTVCHAVLLLAVPCRYVAYPAIFARPGYGSLAPLVLGVTLYGVVSTGARIIVLLLLDRNLWQVLYCQYCALVQF